MLGNLTKLALYYSKEDYDDFLSKGSAYPQISTVELGFYLNKLVQGYNQNTENGLTFPFSIRNQLKTAFSTLKAANALKEELLPSNSIFQ